MGFWQPTTPENTKFTYNVLLVASLCVTGAVWEHFGVWAPFVFCSLFTIFVAWQIYVRPLLTGPDLVSTDDKNRIAFHEMLTGNIAKLEAKVDNMTGVMQNQARTIRDLQGELQSLNKNK